MNGEKKLQVVCEGPRICYESTGFDLFRVFIAIHNFKPIRSISIKDQLTKSDVDNHQFTSQLEQLTL